MHKRHGRPGFTIIELLVTVIVIGILASITLITYRGIRERAEATAIITHVKQYATILEMYITHHGRAPSANWRCLGDSTTLPAGNGYEEGYCFKPANGGTNTGDTAPADPALMTLLRNFEGSLPTSTFPEARGIQGRMYKGIIYDGSTNNFANYPAVIVYFTKLQTCPIGDKVNWWTSFSPTETSGCAYRLSVNENGVRQ